jgi:ElaB/YqjD/DUF883 family membrane-anchored ribosome-binding protein
MANETDAAYDDRVHHAYAKTLDLKQKAGEAMHEFKARIARTVEGVKANAEGARARMGHMLADAKHGVRDQARKLGSAASHARHGAEDFYQETPLAAGAIALAIGALVGSAAPLSRPERETLRGVADKAARTGAELAERGAQAVEERVDGALH